MTRAEQDWCDAIVRLGCIVCALRGHPGTPAEVHHILSGGRRKGHLFTIPLCAPGHHRYGGPDKVSRHPFKSRFELEYGTESYLLAETRRMVAERVAA